MNNTTTKQRYSVKAYNFGKQTREGVKMLRVGCRVIHANNIHDAYETAKKRIKNRDCYIVYHGNEKTRFYPKDVLCKYFSLEVKK